MRSCKLWDFRLRQWRLVALCKTKPSLLTVWTKTIYHEQATRHTHMSLNTVALTGRVGRDPEIKYFESGTMIATFSLAVDGFAKDGEKPTHWIDLKIWGKQAQVSADYVRKGSKIGVSGRLEQENWVDKESGGKRSKLVVVADRLELLGTKQEASDEEVPF